MLTIQYVLTFIVQKEFNNYGQFPTTYQKDTTSYSVVKNISSYINNFILNQNYFYEKNTTTF